MTKKQKIQKYFNQKEKLTLTNSAYLKQVRFFTEFQLSEDLGGKGDLTTNLLIKKNGKVNAKIIAKETGVVAGIEETLWLLKKYQIKFTKHKSDGYGVKKGDVLIELQGGIKDILKTERTVLNLLQRMSGIATLTNRLVQKIGGNVLVCATRKTQWGLLDKKAVTVGGGGTHRLGLYDFVLIKDNHLSQIPNSCLPAGTAKFQIPNSFWEIEADTLKQAVKFAQLKPDAIMLDNFKPKQVKAVVSLLSPEIIFEASGGINESNIAQFAKTGVDIISVGALTHSSKALDISLVIPKA